MEKPNLDQMWETWVKIGPKVGSTLKMLQDTIRNKIYPLVSTLKKRKIINWYHFLLHPYPRDPNNGYFHIRFSVIGNIKKAEDLGLPEYCVSTKKISPIRDISGINRALLINEEIEEAWRVIGEQAEWIIKLVNIHREDEGIPIDQFVQFMHLFMNMMGLGHQAKILVGSKVFSF
jgi:hypothetical protein